MLLPFRIISIWWMKRRIVALEREHERLKAELEFKTKYLDHVDRLEALKRKKRERQRASRRRRKRRK